jgi:hypothetical protein
VSAVNTVTFPFPVNVYIQLPPNYPLVPEKPQDEASTGK